MRKTKVVLAKVLTAAMVISSFAGVQGITSEAAAMPKLSKRAYQLRLGKQKGYRKECQEVYKVSWKIKSKKDCIFQKSGKYAVKVTAKKAGKTTLTAIIKKVRKQRSWFVKLR